MWARVQRYLACWFGATVPPVAPPPVAAPPPRDARLDARIAALELEAAMMARQRPRGLPPHPEGRHE